jgi:hypothetical protein
MDNSTTVVLIIVAFPFFFVGMWSGVCLLLSSLGGWRRLSKSFPATGSPHGTQFYMQTGMVGVVSYRSTLVIHTTPDGFYLSVVLPFRLGHPPMFIPWSAVRNAKAWSFLWVDGVAFEVGEPSVGKLRLPRKAVAGHITVA